VKWREISSIMIREDNMAELEKLHGKARFKHPSDIPVSLRDFLVFLIGVGADMVNKGLESENLIQPASMVTKEMIEQGERLRRLKSGPAK